MLQPVQPQKRLVFVSDYRWAESWTCYKLIRMPHMTLYFLGYTGMVQLGIPPGQAEQGERGKERKPWNHGKEMVIHEMGRRT